MIQGRRSARFLGESMQTVSMLADLCSQHFDGDLAFEFGVTARKTSPIPPAPIGERIS